MMMMPIFARRRRNILANVDFCHRKHNYLHHRLHSCPHFSLQLKDLPTTSYICSLMMIQQKRNNAVQQQQHEFSATATTTSIQRKAVQMMAAKTTHSNSNLYISKSFVVSPSFQRPYFCQFMPSTTTDLHSNMMKCSLSISSSSRSFSSSRDMETTGGKNKQISAAITRNNKIVYLGKKRKWKEILQLYKVESSKYNSVNYSTTMIQLGRISSVDPLLLDDPIFLQFMDDMATKIETLGGMNWIGIQQISNVVHAIGRMGKRRLQSSSSARKIIEFTAKPENANIIVSQGHPQAISIICWSMANLKDLKSFNSFFKQVEPQLDRICNRKDLRTQNLSNMAWACAVFGIQSGKLFAEIESRALMLVEGGKPREVKDMACACAKLGRKSPKLFAAIESVAPWLVAVGRPIDISTTAWSFAKLGVIPSNKFFAEIERHGVRRLIDKGDPKYSYIAVTAWAFATLKYDSKNLLTNIEPYANRLVQNGDPPHIARTALAFVTQGIPSTKFFQSVMDNLEKLLEGKGVWKGVRKGVIPIICSSIAILDLAEEYEEGFRILWSEALSVDPKKWNAVDYGRLAHTYALVSASGMKLQRPTLPTGITTDQNRSPFQVQISKILFEIGFDHEQFVSPYIDDDDESSSFLPENMLSINFACSERKIALEYNGPSSFLIDLQTGKRSNIQTGKAKAKHRFLERIGWKVHTITYMEWKAAKGNEEQRQLLRSILT